MEMLICATCLHPCHCKGVGPNHNTNQCMGDGGNCTCIVCVHNEIKTKGVDMVKKVIGWIWKIICWPFKLIHGWVDKWLNS